MAGIMADARTNRPPPATAAASPTTAAEMSQPASMARQERLAAALRANLGKRKAQQRARAAPPSGDKPDTQ